MSDLIPATLIAGDGIGKDVTDETQHRGVLRQHFSDQLMETESQGEVDQLPENRSTHPPAQPLIGHRNRHLAVSRRHRNEPADSDDLSASPSSYSRVVAAVQASELVSERRWQSRHRHVEAESAALGGKTGEHGIHHIGGFIRLDGSDQYLLLQ